MLGISLQGISANTEYRVSKTPVQSLRADCQRTRVLTLSNSRRALQIMATANTVVIRAVVSLLPSVPCLGEAELAFDRLRQVLALGLNAGLRAYLRWPLLESSAINSVF